MSVAAGDMLYVGVSVHCHSSGLTKAQILLQVAATRGIFFR